MAVHYIYRERGVNIGGRLFIVIDNVDTGINSALSLSVPRFTFALCGVAMTLM